MKETVLIGLVLLGLLNLGFTQNAEVEKQIYGVQTGLFGIWGHRESKLYNKTALRVELGFDNAIWLNYNDNVGYVLVPVLILEPRWYYNLKKRVKKGKRIDNNSGNYFSLCTRMHPDWFVISNYDVGSINPDIFIIPSWGLRRNIGKSFNFEFALGLGKIFYLPNKRGNVPFDSETTGTLTVRFGYTF